MTEDSGQAGALALSPSALEAGVLALVRHYDPDEGGLDNSRLTVEAIVAAVLKFDDQAVDLHGGVPRKLGGRDQL